MPKKVVKLCTLCKERHSFRRSIWKQAKRGGFDICFQFKVSERVYFEGTLTREI